MAEGLKNFEEMEVWQDAQDLACNAYKDLSAVQDVSFVDQLKRAAVSISNNIAEGAERDTDLDFARFLDIAKGSTGEVRSMYRLGVRLGFFSAACANTRCEKCLSICKQLAGFSRYLRNRNRKSREADE
jgi:four helix bundle protein